MNIIERKLLTVFNLLEWQALYQPFSVSLRGEEECFQPSFYLPGIKLFVHCGKVAYHFERNILYGECWRFVPGCPKPVEGDTIRIADLILQPALLRIPDAGIGLPMLIQYKELPGSPESDGMLWITKCGGCGEWSPNANFTDSLCRVCGARGGDKKACWITRRGENDLELGNGWGEHVDIPVKVAHTMPMFICDATQGPQSVKGVSWFGLFDRLLSGPPPQAIKRRTQQQH